MSLTDAQLADTRRYGGYELLPTGVVDPVTIPSTGETLTHRLTSLTTVQETILINTHLATLATLETAVPTASANLDTESAAVWVRNKTEVTDRLGLFNRLRREMCAFIGVDPGPGLDTGASSMFTAPLRF